MNASHGYHNQNFCSDITASIYKEVLNKLYRGSRLQLNFYDHRRHIMANANVLIRMYNFINNLRAVNSILTFIFFSWKQKYDFFQIIKDNGDKVGLFGYLFVSLYL